MKGGRHLESRVFSWELRSQWHSVARTRERNKQALYGNKPQNKQIQPKYLTSNRSCTYALSNCCKTLVRDGLSHQWYHTSDLQTSRNILGAFTFNSLLRCACLILLLYQSIIKPNLLYYSTSHTSTQQPPHPTTFRAEVQSTEVQKILIPSAKTAINKMPH